MMQMDILVVTPRRSSTKGAHFNFFSNPSLFSKSFTISCCQQPRQNAGGGGGGDGDNNNDAKDNNTGGKFSTDWDKAWSSFKNQGKKKKKSLSSQFSPNKYVSWNPRRSNYPLSEEVDPIKRTERSNLMLWTSPRFTLGGAIVIVSMLLIYTLLAPVK